MSEKQKENTKENNREAGEMDDETLLKMIRSGAFKHATNQKVFTDTMHPPAPPGYAAASMMGPAPPPPPTLSPYEQEYINQVNNINHSFFLKGGESVPIKYRILTDLETKFNRNQPLPDYNVTPLFHYNN